MRDTVGPKELTEAAIENLLAAAGNDPLDLKRRVKLRGDLNQFRSMLVGFPSLPPQHGLRKWLQQRLKVAQRERGYFPRWGSKPEDPLDLHIARLEQLERQLERGEVVAVSPDGSRLVSPEVLRNPCKSLAGALPGMYEAAFRRQAGVSRTLDGTPSGSYIRFARACFKEFGLSYGDEAIIKALKAYKATCKKSC